MKKTNILLMTTIVASTMLSGASVVSAKSASDPSKDGIEVKEGETSTSATTTAEFSVEAGELSFDSAPDFNFGKHSILDILKGQLDQQDNVINNDKGAHQDSHTNVNESGDKLNSENSGVLQISDYRGAGSVWKLMASISDFTNETGEGSVSGTITLPSLGSDASIGNGTTKVWDSTAANTNGQGVANIDLSKGSVLQLRNAKNIQAGKYDATITWTLQNTSITATQG